MSLVNDGAKAKSTTQEKKKPKSKPRLLYVGLHLPCPVSLQAAFETSMQMGFSFVLTPLVHPRAARNQHMVMARKLAFTRSDLVLRTEDWSTCVVGQISDWICYGIGSSSINERYTAEFALAQELQWSQHVGVPAIQIMYPTNLNNHTNFSRCLNQLLLEYRGIHVWLTIPLHSSAIDPVVSDQNTDLDARDNSWHVWNQIRTFCGYNPSLSVCIEIGQTVPENPLHLQRWFGEPVKAALIHVDAFQPNEQGFPVLPKLHQIYIKELLKHSVQFILTGRAKHKLGILPYLQYLRYLKDTLPEETYQEVNEKPYYDYLQEPLQPLFHNLESATYNVFEQCPVKYVKYEEAISRYLKLKLKDGDKKNETIELMVVGAGRGPLVMCAIRAAQSNNVANLNIIAVEKNPNAVVTLKSKFSQYKNVQVVASDMRLFQPSKKADVLVSELLGSFGDNELSPECLDGAQRFLDPQNGVSIPCDSTSYLAPISTNKLWNECSKFKDMKHLEIPYVVKLHDFFEIAAAKECLTFVHPNLETEVDNRRFRRIIFRAKATTLCHGFAGYFESTLYDGVSISTNPKTVSVGMFSWFPMYFPVSQPFLIKQNEMIEVNFWRCIKNRKVWYEWCVVQPQQSPIHNVNGRSAWIGM